ncbi:MAG: class D sortase [Clostridia bacterium]|nr:class D sortase [Clostridia bacterium]
MKTFFKKQKKSTKRLLTYICVPIIFCWLGFGLLYFVFSPIIATASSTLNLITSDSITAFDSGVSDIYKGSSYSGEAVDCSDIKIPTENTKYANLVCERINLDVPVYFGDNDVCLHYGAGQFSGSMLPGFGSPTLIAGHNFTSFAPLQFAKDRDFFTLTTNYGVYKYRVSEIKIMNKNAFDKSILSMDSNQLILYTCYPFTPVSGVRTDRLFLFCEMISGPMIVNINGN